MQNKQEKEKERKGKTKKDTRRVYNSTTKSFIIENFDDFSLLWKKVFCLELLIVKKKSIYRKTKYRINLILFTKFQTH